jgi:hypothetical protein
VLPAGVATTFASALPFVELTLGSMLLLGLFTGFAATFAALLFLTFSLAISINLARGRSFDCHCFGSVQHDEIGPGALIRSLVLAFAALAIAVEPSAFGALDALVFGSEDLPPRSELLPAVFIAFVIVDALVLLPELATFRDIFSGRYDTRPEAVRSHVRPLQPAPVEAHTSNGHHAHIPIDEVREV